MSVLTLGVRFQHAHLGETHPGNSSLFECILLGDKRYADVICDHDTHVL